SFRILGNSALRMGADGGERRDTVRHARLLFLIEGGRIEPNKHNLIEPRAIARLRRLRIERPSVDKWPTQRHVGRLDDLACLVTPREHELVALFWAFIALWVFLLLRARRDCGQPKRQRKPALQEEAAAGRCFMRTAAAQRLAIHRMPLSQRKER